MPSPDIENDTLTRVVTNLLAMKPAISRNDPSND